ncbi:MAG: SCO family protein [Burkholderiaceae bacterium]|jgi:protein SCO1/2|nr:MAG: SCO family protein [Burkholderiaceae bacterium]
MRALRTLLASLALAAAGVLALAAATNGFRAFTTETARRQDVRAHPRLLPAIALESDRGVALQLSAYRGRWLLIDFVYTRCETYCSALGGEFAQLQGLLAAPIASNRVALLSISFDPAHDDPAALRAYRQRFGDRGAGWTAARPANAAALTAVTQNFGLKAVPDGLGGFVHNVSLAVVDPTGRLVDILDSGDPRAIAASLQKRIGT